ncbi:MAG: hypothetical protein ABWZ78_07315 [Burkholderiaceae bacterium]
MNGDTVAVEPNLASADRPPDPGSRDTFEDADEVIVEPLTVAVDVDPEVDGSRAPLVGSRRAYAGSTLNFCT